MIRVISECHHGYYLLGSYFMLPKLSLHCNDTVYGITLTDYLVLWELCLEDTVHIPVTDFISGYHW